MILVPVKQPTDGYVKVCLTRVVHGLKENNEICRARRDASFRLLNKILTRCLTGTFRANPCKVFLNVRANPCKAFVIIRATPCKVIPPSKSLQGGEWSSKSLQDPLSFSCRRAKRSPAAAKSATDRANPCKVVPPSKSLQEGMMMTMMMTSSVRANPCKNLHSSKSLQELSVIAPSIEAKHYGAWVLPPVLRGGRYSARLWTARRGAYQPLPRAPD